VENNVIDLNLSWQQYSCILKKIDNKKIKHYLTIKYGVKNEYLNGVSGISGCILGV